MLALEPRVLFDGAAVVTGAEVVDVIEAGDVSDIADLNGAGLGGAGPVLADEVSRDAQLLVAMADVGESGKQQNEIAVVDTGIENYQSILDSIGDDIEVVLIDNKKDGIEQIAAVLAGRHDVDSVHIISHGRAGVLNLGTATLNADTIAGQYSDELAVIADVLSDRGDILIYGCNFGQGDLGVEAVNALAKATGADVAASNDLTGWQQRNGDWDLEVQNGEINAIALNTLADGSLESANVLLANSAPILDNDGDDSSGQVGGDYEVTFTENGAAVSVVDTDVDIFDSDSDLITEASVVLTNGQIGDTLNVSTLPAGLAAISVPNPPGPLVAAGSITVNIIGNGTSADYEAALQAITFQSNAEDSNVTDRIVDIQVSEFANVSNVTSTIIHVIEVNDRPVLDLDGDNSRGLSAGNYQSSYSENDPPVAIADSDTILQDLDHVNMQSAQIALTNGQIGDVLNVGTLPSGISLVGATPVALTSAGTIIVQLTGDASLADYQIALQAIGFSSVSEDPDFTQRIINVTVNDGQDNTNAATSLISVLKVNDAPVAVDDTDVSDEDTAISIVAADGLVDLNDNDVDAADVLVVSAVNGSISSVGSQITLSSGALLTVHANGSYDYDPNGMYEGLAVGDTATDSFNYTLSDGNGGTDTANVTLTITGVNDAPVAGADSNSTDEDSTINVSAAGGLIDQNDSDMDTGDVLVVSAVNGSTGFVDSQITLSSGALLTVHADGSYDYDPNGMFERLAVGVTATDGFDYTLSDGNGGTDTANVTLTIIGVNDSPVVIDPDNPNTPLGDPDNVIFDVVAVDGETPAVINVADYIIDPEGDDLTFAATGLPPGLMIGPLSGLISGTIEASASQGGLNSDGVYQVIVTGIDPSGEVATTTITYTISNVAPVATDDTISGDEDTGQSGNVLIGDLDGAPDSDDLVVSGVSSSSVGVPQSLTYGDLTINGDGSWVFVPNETANGLAVGVVVSETVTYTISDGQGGFDSAELTIKVSGVNDAPVVINSENPDVPPGDTDHVIPDVVAEEGQDIVIPAGDYFVDPDGDELVFTVTGLPAGLDFDPDNGEIAGVLDPAVLKEDSFTITVTADDGHGGTVSTSFVIRISDDVLPLPPTSDVGGDEFAKMALSNPDLSPELGQIITQLVRWIGVQDQGWMSDLVNDYGYRPYAGQEFSMEISQDGNDGQSKVQLGTLVVENVMFVEVGLNYTNGGDSAKVLNRFEALSADGSPLQDYINLVGPGALVVNVPVDTDWVGLRLRAYFDSGTSEFWEVKISSVSGEILLVEHGGDGSTAFLFRERLLRFANSWSGEFKAMVSALNS